MENNMSYKLTVRAFFFNAKTDYLPYYKNFTLDIAEDATAKDILKAIEAQNDMFTYPELNLVFKVNGLVMEEDTLVSAIVERLGTELQIDPVSRYRTKHGLIINDDDFMQSFEHIAPYATESDKKYFKSLYAVHYASETSLYERGYIGDAVLLTAHKIIKEGTEHQDAILEAITSAYSGLFDCEYENNFFDPQNHHEEISALKHLARPEDEPSLFSLLMIKLFKKEEVVEKPVENRTFKTVTIENLLEKNIAYYKGTSTDNAMETLLEEMEIKTVSFSKYKKLCGLTLIEDNKDLAFRKAGAVLLDAYDAGAEVLVVENIDKYEMISKYFKNIEKTIGRKMLGLELICAEDFVAQLSKTEA